MMAKTKYFEPLSGATRSSHRPYTHAVVGQYDLAASVASATTRAIHDAKGSWKWANEIVALGLGALRFESPSNPKWNQYVTEYEYTRAREIVDCGSVEAYTEVRVAEYVRNVSDVADGTWLCRSWSMSYANASKAASKRVYNLRNIRVVPALVKA